MGTFRVEADWLTVHARVLRHVPEDTVLLQTLRTAVFRQMLEPPTRERTRTIVEGRPMVGAQHRLKSLGFEMDLQRSVIVKASTLEC